MKNKEVIINELSFELCISYCEWKRIFPLKRLINLQPYEIYSTFESMYNSDSISYDKQLNRIVYYVPRHTMREIAWWATMFAGDRSQGVVEA